MSFFAAVKPSCVGILSCLGSLSAASSAPPAPPSLSGNAASRGVHSAETATASAGWRALNGHTARLLAAVTSPSSSAADIGACADFLLVPLLLVLPGGPSPRVGGGGIPLAPMQSVEGALSVLEALVRRCPPATFVASCRGAAAKAASAHATPSNAARFQILIKSFGTTKSKTPAPKPLKWPASPTTTSTP